jgi:hypothetical protein
MGSFQEFMSRCHNKMEQQHPAESGALTTFLQSCQDQTGYIMQSQEPGGGGGH